MNYQISDDFLSYKEQLALLIENFESEGEAFGKQERNSLKLFKLAGTTLNVKSFKIPNIVNQLAYRFFRKSKAQRSFEHACKLSALGIGTPKPVAYYEYPSVLTFGRSFYISEHLDYDYTYRDILRDYSIPYHEQILRAFTRFTFKLHENNVLFLDHSPGNTLITITEGTYEFYLVDLNRMTFKALDFKTRIKNFARLATKKEIIEIMSDEYAKCLGVGYDEVFDLMWRNTNTFQEKYHRRRRLKKKLKFWK